MIDQAVDRQRLNGQSFGQRLHGVEFFGFHVVPFLHSQDGGVDVRFLEAQILDRRIDVAMPQRLLSPENVPAQLFIDPVREGLPHAVRGDLAGQFIRFDDSFQDAMILDPAQRSPALAAGE